MWYTVNIEKIQRGLTKSERISLEQMRRCAIERVLDGIPVKEVAEFLGYSKQAVHAWVRLYNAGGYDALNGTKSAGAEPKLTEKQMLWLQKTISTKTPAQLQFDFGLWTREIVKQLIIQKFNISLGVTTIGPLLHRLGFSVQKPLQKAFEQDPQRVESWLRNEYPALKRAAIKARATVFFADEAGIRSDYHSGTTWAPVGKTPVVLTTGSRVSCNMLSAVSAGGSMRFMVTTKSVNTEVFIEFLKRLMKNAKNPVYLIVDGHPTHRAKKTQTYVASTQGKLKLFFLPPYSPELNPDELVWNQVKHHGVGRKLIFTREQLISSATSALRQLQRCPEKIRGCFGTTTTIYAAV
jgi:transposase